MRSLAEALRMEKHLNVGTFSQLPVDGVLYYSTVLQLLIFMYYPPYLSLVSPQAITILS